MHYVIAHGKGRYNENFHLCGDGKFSMGFWSMGRHSKHSTRFYKRKGMAEHVLAKLQRKGRVWEEAFVKEVKEEKAKIGLTTLNCCGKVRLTINQRSAT